MPNETKPLVILPKLIPTESLMGLILRASEANGYSNPNIILRYAGLSEGEIRSIRPPLEKIAPLFGKTTHELAKAYSDPEITKQKKKWHISNHVIPSLYVNVKSIGICPECILENGFIENIWELQFARVCTKHQRELVDRCPFCKKQLKWQRIGLLKCACGQDLSDVRGEKVEDRALLNITELIRWKLNNHEYDEQNLVKSGYPLTELKNISLSTILGIIERLQSKRKRKTNFAEPFGVDSKLNVIKLASDMLANWPKGFYDLLQNLSPDYRHIASRNLQSQYSRIYNSFFKSGLPVLEMKFIRIAFVTFANEHLGKDVYIDSRLAKHAETSRRYVGILGLSEHLKIRLPTIRSYIKKGLLKPQMHESMGKTRAVFDLENIPFKAREGNYLKQREAAQFMKLNVRLLNAFKSNGVYKISRLGWGIDGYNQLDLLEFKESIINKAPRLLNLNTSEQLCLREIFRKKLYLGVSVKIVEEILVGALVPLGRTGNEIPDIILTKESISTYLTA